MNHTEMLDAHPQQPGDLDQELLSECIAACFDCAQACTACADACLAEEMVAQLTRCIRADLDCADICLTTGKALSRLAGFDADVARAFLLACVAACRSCGDECESHAEMHDHCRVCAESCRRCERACRELLASLD